MDALSSLTQGDSLYIDGNYEGAIESYTTAICLTDSRRTKDKITPTDTPKSTSAADENATTTNDESKAKEEEEANTIKAIRFRSLSHRSETYLSLSKYTHAYNDANAALALYPLGDTLDYNNSSSSSADSNIIMDGGLRLSELCIAHDRIARASGKFYTWSCVVISPMKFYASDMKLIFTLK